MGPLSGVKIVELAGVGPGPLCGMLLADMGADVVRIDRKTGSGDPLGLDPTKDVLARGRRSIALDLKSPEGIEIALSLIDSADAMFEGFRPGVAERLGLGPDICRARNPKLVYGRITGWGQTGPMAQRAGHDINYISLSGALNAIGRAGDKPVPPLALVGDMGGGGQMFAFGMVCALFEAARSGKGQVIDAAMFEGASVLMSMFWGMRAMGQWSDARGTNVGDTGAPFYEVYETKDGLYVSIGPVEPQFYREFIARAGVDPAEFTDQMNPKKWPAMKERLTDVFKTKTRDEWVAIYEGIDACVTPVLSMGEAPTHPQCLARGSFIEVAGVTQPAPAPRFSRTPGSVRRPPPRIGQDAAEILSDWSVPADRITAARAAGAIL